MVIYTQLFWYVKPATVIEIGAYSGGTAVWMADMLKLMNVECSVYSMDIDLSLIDNRVKKLQPYTSNHSSICKVAKAVCAMSKVVENDYIAKMKKAYLNDFEELNLLLLRYVPEIPRAKWYVCMS